ncbi:MAG: DUF1275 domain-containing protein [Rhizobiaceae bacterium]|nr:DUF1275 domain-containing protein [Rhizobiaceae bacterium]
MARGRRGTLLRRRRARVGLGFAAALSALAGMTDAIGLLVAGDFVSFMSGNTTRFAVALGSSEWVRAAELGAIVATFVFGNAAGVVFAALTGRRHGVLLGLVAVLLSIAALLSPFRMASTLLLVFSMGFLNVAVERVEGRALGVTYVTGALSRFGRGIGQWLLGHGNDGWRLELVPWLGMLSGALVGVIGALWLGPSAIWMSAVVAAFVAVVSALIPARWREHYFVSPRRGS